jgi:uncharacterized protein with GYD domain
MPQYLTHFAYTAQAWAALTQNPVDRSEPIKALAERLGCRLISLHYTMGDYDGVTLIDAPDDVTAMACLMGAIAPGHLKATKTIRLYTPAEALEAMRKAGGAAFQAPSSAPR